MNDSDYKNILENARRDSINYTKEEGEKRRIPLEFCNVEMDPLKKSLIDNVVTGLIITCTDLYIINIVKRSIDDYTNSSYNKGYEVITEETDGEGVASVYSSSLDFESFIYGIFVKIKSTDKKMLIIKMNNIFYWLNLYGYTNYSNFEDYCISKGYYSEESGSKRIDIAKYDDNLTIYLKEYKEKEESR